MPSKRRKRRKNTSSRLWTITCVIALITLYFILNGIEIDINNEVIEVGSTYESADHISWLGIDLTEKAEVSGYVNSEVLGTYNLEYTFLDKTYPKKVTVVDTTPPIFAIIEENKSTTVTATSIEEFSDPGFIVADNYDKDLKEQVETKIEKISNKEYNVIYSVYDSSGNYAQAQRKVIIQKGVVYLTFDDGPSETITPQILEILKSNNVKATFFLVGYPENMNELVMQEYAEGHTIGLHGYSHQYSDIYCSIENLMQNFQDISEEVYTTTNGYISKFIRFPGGSSNTVSKRYCQGIMTLAAQKVTENGYTYFDWNVDSNDAGGADSSEEIYKNVTESLTPGTNVVLMHDGYGHQATVDALQKIITYCIDNGYELKAIDENAKIIQHPISN